MGWEACYSRRVSQYQQFRWDVLRPLKHRIRIDHLQLLLQGEDDQGVGAVEAVRL